ncbi:MAG TPA: sensor histidine kinase [Actinomycetota bacterium]|nr:sensor histidine kinase [Actinomycetota bacterium]
MTADLSALAPDRSRSRLAWSLLVVSIVSSLVGIVLAVHTWRTSDAVAVELDWSDAVYVLVFLPFPFVGALIASRRPENSIGWLLLGIGVVQGLSLAAGGYAGWAIYTESGAPAGDVVAASLGWTWIPVVAVPATFLLLLFPDGHLPSRRWRWFARVLALGMVLASIGIIFTPGEVQEYPGVENPIGVADLQILSLGLSILPIGVVGAVISLILRYRQSQADERQQIRWVAAAAAIVGAMYTTALIATWVTDSGWDGTGPGWIPVLQTACLAAFALIPIAMGVGILRYHLYDLGLVVRKTLVFAVLAAVIAAVYVGVVVGVGAIVGSRASPVLSALAAAVVALVFQPVRTSARRFADRVVFGSRATPYEVMTAFGDQLAGTYASEDVLPRIARVLGEGVGAERACVRLSIDGELRVVASWPAEPGDQISVADQPDGFTAEVRHQGELLGALAVAMPPNDPMNPSKERLVHDLAAQAGLVLRNERLTAALKARLAELKAAQRRLVSARDHERRRLERNIHDGAQQQLVALQVRQRLAEQLIDRDPAKAKEMLSVIQIDTGAALDDLRDLARGIYPPLLADKGLQAALEAQARKAAMPITIEADGIGRLPQDVEAAIYFSALEALQNTAKYADAHAVTVSLERVDGGVGFTVRDDGRGFEPSARSFGTGLQGIADRLGALDGELDVQSAPGSGTTVRGRVPVGPQVHAAKAGARVDA